MSPIDFSGVHLFSVTPTDIDGHIAPALFKPHFDRAISAGIRSITVFGSAGAIGSFDETERKRIAEAAVDAADGRVPVFVGTGAMTTDEALRLTVHAREVGAAAALVVPITYWPLTEPELTQHYRAISEQGGLPVIIYNNPRTTGVDMAPPFLATLSRMPGVVAIKESGPDVSRISETLRLNSNSAAVLTGRDPQIIDALRVGASGWFSGGANVMPELCVQLDELMRADQMSAALSLFEKMVPLTDFAITKGGVRVLHTALELMGRSMGAPRAPLLPLQSTDRSKLSEILQDLGLMG